jgi:general secretion pathway protein J
VDAAAERNAELRIALGFIARAISQARPVTLTLDGTPVQVLSGDEQNLELAAPLSENVGIAGLNILRVGLDDERLVLTRWLMHPDVLAGTAEIPAWEPLQGQRISAPIPGEDRDIAGGAYGTTLLAEGVTELQIAYFGPREDDLGPTEDEWLEGEWQTEWLERRDPPVAIRIRMMTADSDWPDLVVLTADADATAAAGRRRGTQTSARP